MTNSEILIGLAELPDLAPPLQAAGLSPISGGNLREVATDIRKVIEAGREVAVVAMQTATMGLSPFLTRVSATAAARVHPVVLLHRPDAEPLPIPGAVCLELPVSLAEIITESGVELTATEHTKLAAVIVAEDGTAHAAPSVSRDEVDEDDWLAGAPWSEAESHTTDDDPWAAQQDEPDPAPTRALPPSERDENPWGEEPEIAAPSRPTHRAPEAPIAPPRQERRREAPPPEYQPPVRRPESAAPAQRPPYDDWDGDDYRSGEYRRDRVDPRDVRAALSTAPPADLFTQPGVGLGYANSPNRFAPARRGGLAPVVFTLSGKGGTGKTSTAINIAQRAASTDSNLRVVLVDMNRGQGDIRKYLRIPRDANPRCVVDAAHSGNPVEAILAPRELAGLRHRTLEETRFAVALAPPRDQTDPGLASADVYLSIINFARRQADLVVVDTQIIEGTDTSGLIDRIVTPTLATDGWAMGIADTSLAGPDHLMDVLINFENHGAVRDRILTLINRAEVDFPEDEMAASFAPYSFASFCVAEQSEIVDLTNSGQFVHSRFGFAEPIDTLLYRILALPEFDPTQHDPDRRSGGKRRRWGWRAK